MKKSQIIFAISAVVLASGCAMKTKVLDAGAVSMTHQSLKPGQALQEKGQVTGQFCADTFGDKGQIGLMDEAIKSAQKTHGVDWITNATFYLTSASCVSVEGTGQKIVSSNEAPAAPEAPIQPASSKQPIQKMKK